MARSPAASAGCGWLAGAAGHRERGRLGYLRRDLGVLLLMAALQRGDLRAELRVIGIGDVDGRELLQVRDAPQLLAHMRRELQVRPVAVEVLEHIHRAVLELPAELRAHDVRLHRGVGPGLAKHLHARPALLLAQTGLVSRQVDVEDQGLLLLLMTGRPSGRPGLLSDGRGSHEIWAVMATSSWLLAASLAPVCVNRHHADCVITCRIRAPAGAIPAAALIASDSLRHSPAARGVTAIRAVR